jgi:hypothetical protein
MGANPAHEVNIADDLEGESVVPAHAAFPDVSGICHLLDPQRWVTGIIQEELELLCRTTLHGHRECLEVPLKRRRGLDSHDGFCLRGRCDLSCKCTISASTLVNG